MSIYNNTLQIELGEEKSRFSSQRVNSRQRSANWQSWLFSNPGITLIPFIPQQSGFCAATELTSDDYRTFAYTDDFFMCFVKKGASLWVLMASFYSGVSVKLLKDDFFPPCMFKAHVILCWAVCSVKLMTPASVKQAYTQTKLCLFQAASERWQRGETVAIETWLPRHSTSLTGLYWHFPNLSAQSVHCYCGERSLFLSLFNSRRCAGVKN